MNKAGSQAQNPSLKELEILVGDWNMELLGASFLPDPAQTISGQAAFEWVEAGAFLSMYMGEKPPGVPDAVWLIGRDESVEGYTVLYFDSRKVSRVYQMSFSDGIWKLWRNSPGFSQRFEGKLSGDGQSITARWEKSLDGKKWEHDFNVTYTRLR